MEQVMDMDSEIIIRAARPDDAADLLEIYKWYVERTALSYEYFPPSEEEFRGRINNIMKCYPYLVAERDGQLLGYAYAGRFREREAYAWNAETSVYLRTDARGMGLGRKLYSLLGDILRAQGAVKLIANITEPVDECSDFGSMQFHSSMGYRIAGRLENCGYKFGRWYSTVIMEKNMNTPMGDMPALKDFERLRNSFGL